MAIEGMALGHEAVSGDQLPEVPAPDPQVDTAAGLLRVLGAPVRLALLVELGDRPRCVHELVDALYDAGRPVSQPLVSQHLRVLRESRLVTATRSGHEVVYALADEHVGHVVRDALSHARHAGQRDGAEQ